jgi:hypothetical protein
LIAMQSTTLTRASREWFSRPDDQRYLTLNPHSLSLGPARDPLPHSSQWIRDIATVPTGPARDKPRAPASHRARPGPGHEAPKSPPFQPASSVTLVGSDYGRIYDHEVVRAVMEANEEGRWHTGFPWSGL